MIETKAPGVDADADMFIRGQLLDIAAGVNAKALARYMGHGTRRSRSPTTGTGICSPGNEEEAAELLDT
jgi:hypothetical protein